MIENRPLHLLFYRRWYWYSPIGADEWADSSSSYLTEDSCWHLCYNKQPGDVIAEHGHVGIVTGDGLTTSASAVEDKIVENDWGFRSGQNPTCWRYTCYT